MAADWQNPLLGLDVDDDAFIAPRDVLSVINDINAYGARKLTTPFDSGDLTAVYIDVDGDGHVSPSDALDVINHINAKFSTVQLQLQLAADTGTFEDDLVTRDSRIAVNATGASSDIVSARIRLNRGSVVDVPVDADGNFLATPAIAGIADGLVTAKVLVVDAQGLVGLRFKSFTFDATPPAAPSLSLSAASGVVSPQTSNASRVTLVGNTDPGMMVTLVQPATNALANRTGDFRFNSVPLNLGDNVFTATATDLAGNTVQTPTTIRRIDAPSTADPVLAWNQANLQAIRSDATDPTRGTRGMAMVQTAIYDVVNAIENRTGYYVTLAPPADVSLEAAIAGAAHQVLKYLYPAQQASFDTVMATSLANVPDGATETSSVAFGRQVADAIIALRESDGWDDFVDYVPGNSPGEWIATEPIYVVALDPHWATLRPWAMSSPDQFRPPGPPSLGSQEWADAYNEVRTLGAHNSTARTADQTQIARFWADGAGTSTPPGHWNVVAQQVAAAAGNSIAENARLFAMLNIALADAAIAAWDAKYDDEFWRPITAIQNGATDGNDLTVADPAWLPFLISPPFPDYISGHSTFSGAAATVLTAQFGANYAFTATSEGLTGVTRSFASFDAAAEEAGQSRIYGGIHYSFANADGKTTGKAVANLVMRTFDTTSDAIAPRVFFDSDSDEATTANPSIVGYVLDNLSGVASLTASVDGGPAIPVVFNALGRFVFGTSLPLDGSADGTHTVSFVARDASGNVSSSTPFTFTLDTVKPTLSIESPAAGASLAAGDALSGTVGGSGSTIVALSYAFSGQPTMPIAFNTETGEFRAPLNLSKLAPGPTTLTISARDAAGNATTTTRNLSLAARVPFDIGSFTPLDGAKDVGSTYRPQVFFSRPVNPASLTANNFYATGPSGAKLAANIVPSGDGTFAWLFFTLPMPSSSEITVHLDGATILAAGDGAPLDADGNGSTGGQFSFKFSTVSLTPLLGTSLSGKVLDVGRDLKPMTFDDIRVGPDQVMHTADDVYLLPIAGVKVFVVGLDDQFVLTDAAGNFHFDSVPAGNLKLAIDGRTATNASSGVFFPEMVMDLMLDAGRANTVMGTMGTDAQKVANRDRQEIYLPRLQTSILQNVSTSNPTMITVVPDAAANLTAEQRSLLTINVQPGSLRDQNGNPVAAGQVGISTVPPSLVREMLPPGLLQHTFDITVQSPGITNFSTPAPMTFPNLFGAKPGEQLNFLSFDHTTGRLVIEGSATVSADGLSVNTDPGTGITHPGWHGLTPRGSPTGPDDDKPPLGNGTDFSFRFAKNLVIDDVVVPNTNAASLAANRELPSIAAGELPPQVSVTGLRDYLLTKNGDRIRIHAQNTTDRNRSDGSYVRIKITVERTSQDVLDGLQSTTVFLYPGQELKFDFALKSQDVLRENTDLLIGAKFHLEMSRISNLGVVTPITGSGDYYVYRYLDALDDRGTDDNLKFAPTIQDGAGKHLRTRPIEYRGDKAAIPALSLESDDPADLRDFSHTQFDRLVPKPMAAITFDPLGTVAGGIAARLKLKTPGETPHDVLRGLDGDTHDHLPLNGNGVGPRVLYANLDGLKAALADIANGAATQAISLVYTLGPGETAPQSSQQFVLKYGNRPPSRRLPVNADRGAVKDQLTQVMGFSPANVTVDASTSREARENGTTQVTQKYTIKLQGENPQERFEVEYPTATVPPLVEFDFNLQSGTISLNERQQFNTPEKRNQLADEVFARMRQLLSSYIDAGEIELKPDPGVGAYSVTWKQSFEPGEYGNNPLPRLAFVDAQIGFKDLVKDLGKSSAAQNSFKLAQLLSQTATQGVEVYVNTHYESTYPDWDQNFAIVTRELAQTAVHELGHSLGLTHSSNGAIVATTDEVQKLDLSFFGPNEPVQLSFAGELSGALSRSDLISSRYTAQDVQDALYNLSAFKRWLYPPGSKQELHVEGPAGGPFTIFYANPQLIGRKKFERIDMPQLLAIGASGGIVGALTETNGGRTIGVNKEPRVFSIKTNSSTGPNDSLYDVMASGNQAGVEASFQEKVSGAAMNFATRGNWSVKDSKAYISALFQMLRGRALKREGADPEFDFSFVDADGPLLALFDDGSQLIPDVTEFGSASTVSPSIRHFSLVNLGSENATIRAVRITKGNAFSVPTMPVKVLLPGESLEFDITFAPDAVLNYEGTLSVDSDVEGFNGVYELVGDGNPTNTPAIKLDFYNNLGPVQVGQPTGFSGNALAPTLTNVGTAPLTITEIRVAAGQGFGEWTTTPLAQPMTLAVGQSTGIAFRLTASKPGLRPGTIEVLSDDPRTPVLRIPVVATGVIVTQDSLNQNIYHGVDLGNDYVVVSDQYISQFGDVLFANLPTLRTRSDDGGNWEFFLPAETGVMVNTYDPVSGLIATGRAFTNASGVATEINRGTFIPTLSPDTDGDGLPDDIEFTIGTNPNQVDTDDDGTNDFAELDTGSNPSDDRPTASGIVSALATGATALDIKLSADFRDPSRSLAYIASGASGLTIVDVTDFARPIAIAQLSVPGAVNNLSLDVGRKLVAAASPTNGVHLIDVADPSRPTLLRTLQHEGTDPVAAVELHDGLIYVGVGGKIRIFDAQSGELTSDFALGTQRVLGMSRGGERLYATVQDTGSSDRLLRIFDITTAGLTARGSLVLPGIATAGDPYFTNDIERIKIIIVQTPVGPREEEIRVRSDVVWIPAGDRVVTVDVSNPQSPEIITSTATIAQGGAADIELNGSGLAVIAGVVNPGGSAIVLDAPFPNDTNQIFTRFALPSFGEGVALSSGLAYIADGISGLQLVNFLQRDTGLRPPTVFLNALLGDVDPTQSGLQLYEGATVTLGNQITDDVQVRKVELMVDGTVVRTELSFPYDLTTVLPTRAQSGNQAVLQVRATDSGGNSTLSDPIVIDLVADATAPTISTLDPAGGSTQPLSRRKVTLTFSEAIDRATAIPANFVLQGPSGPITPISVDLRQRDTQIQILYPPLPPAAYTFITRAAAVKDRAGNALGTTDIISTFTVAAVQRDPTIRWVNDAGGEWNIASNWRDVATNTARLPTATDDVLIDVPTEPTISISADVVTVNSLVSNERFEVVGGISNGIPRTSRLNVTTTIQVNNTFLLSGNYLHGPATFSGTLLRGTGGQGLTINGHSRLDAATIQTDILVNQDATRLWIANGLALEGTLTVSAPGCILYAEGTQTWSSGTFVTTMATASLGPVFVGSVGISTLTLGENVTFQAQVTFQTGLGPPPLFGQPIPGQHQLSLINHGTIKARPATATQRYGVFTRTESFTNHGVVSAGDYGTVSIGDKVWTNAATGRIKVSNGIIPEFPTAALGIAETTTSGTNAGTIELINSLGHIYEDPFTAAVGRTWSNTGTIIVDKSRLELNGSYTSADVANIANTGFIIARGVMDNTGRTFTYANTVGAFGLYGRTLGGTIVQSGAAKLLLGGALVGATLRGDFNSGGVNYTDPVYGFLSARLMNVKVEQGLTLEGSIAFYRGNSVMEFVGAPQTVSGGTFQYFNGTNAVGYFNGMRTTGGPVTFDSTVTIRISGGLDVQAFSINGNFISHATIVIDANSSLSLAGMFGSLNPSHDGPFVNRGTITVPATRTLSVFAPFTNEGQITNSGGSLNIGAVPFFGTTTFKNTGGISQASGFTVINGGADSNPRAVTTADLGNFNVTGGFVDVRGLQLDNAGATLLVKGTSQWSVADRSIITGGTIQIDPTAKFASFAGNPAVLKDVTVNGNLTGGSFALVGDLDFNGTLPSGSFQFGHPTLFAGTPLVLRGGQFSVGIPRTVQTLTGHSTAPSIAFDPDVTLKGGMVNATFPSPLTNRGQIVAEQQQERFWGSDVFHFTATPITNEGTLSAVNRAILRIANLAAPNSGIVFAGAGSSVQFTDTFAQGPTGTTRIDIAGTTTVINTIDSPTTTVPQFGSVAVTGAATLAGTLNVQFVSGYTPPVGTTFKVLTYASRTGTFATVNVTGLANGLTLTPQYNATDLTLVVGAAAGGEGEFNALTTEYLAAGATFEQSFSPNSKSLAPSTSTELAYAFEKAKMLFTARNRDRSTAVAQGSRSEQTPPKTLRSNDDDSAAVDEVFTHLGHKLLWTKI